MILLCDENISPQVADALRRHGYDARSFQNLGWLGTDDPIWLARVQNIEDSLVVSRDRMLLTKPNEIQAIMDNGVGIVLLTGGQQPVENVIQLLLDTWEQLEELHNATPRPFARFLTTDGRLRQRLHGRGL